MPISKKLSPFILFSVTAHTVAIFLGLWASLIPTPYSLFVFLTLGILLFVLGLGAYGILLYRTLKKTGAL